MPAQPLTAKWIENSKPPHQGRIDYFDTRQSGLVLRISDSGRKSFGVVFRVSGDRKLRRLTIGPHPVVSLAEARGRAKEVIAEASKGEDPAADRQIEKGIPTFSDLTVGYMELYAHQKRSKGEDQRIIDKDLLPAWGSKRANLIKRRDVVSLLDRIVERGAPISANRTLALIRKIFNWAISRDIVEINPCTQVKAPAKENRRDRILSDTEIQLF